MRQVARRMLIGFLCLSSGSLASAQGRLEGRYPLVAETVARALHRDGLDVRVEDVRLPTQLSTAVNDPDLEVVGADRLPDGHLRLRLRCHSPGECLPFSVTLTRSPAAATLLAYAATQPTRLDVRSSSTAPVNQENVAASETPSVPVSVRAGTRLTMLVEDGHMHIHLPVVSLADAAAGREIRVATPDHKHTYRATVVDATTVRGTIE